MKLSGISVRILARAMQLRLAVKPTLWAIVFAGLMQIGPDSSAERESQHSKRSLYIMHYGYELPIEITGINRFHDSHWVRELELEIKNISAKPSMRFISCSSCRTTGTALVGHMR